MTNLDRLKGSGLLVDGFESFVANWLNETLPNEAPLSFDPDKQEVFDQFPYEVRRFYEVVNRWPQSNIVCDNNQDGFIEHPRYQKTWKKSEWIFDTSYATLGVENQGNWEVVIGLDGDNYGKLFTDRDNECEYPGDWIPMRTSPEEFLVTLGFHEMVICGRHKEPSLIEIDECKLVFTGHYQGDWEIRIYNHDSGGLCMTDKDDRVYWACEPN